MAFFSSKPNVNPIGLSQPVMGIDAETGVSPGTNNAGVSSITNQASSGGAAGTYSSGVKYRGINRAGAEYGESWIDGTPCWTGQTYFEIPSSSTWAAELSYLAGKGFNYLRIPFSWERAQHTLNGPLNTTYWSAYTAMVNQAVTAGLRVVVDCHNYARYAVGAFTDDQGSTQASTYTQHQTGDGTLTFAHWANLWIKVAGTFASYPANMIDYNIMNEPHDLLMTSTTFFSGIQTVMNAIRTVDVTHTINVPNTRASDIDHWVNYSPGDIVLGGGNGGPLDSVAALAITDSANNFAFDMHCHYEVAPGEWSSDLVDVTNWAITNGRKLVCTEMGIHSDNANGSTLVAGFMNQLNNNANVWIGFAAWNLPPQNLTATNNYLADGTAMAWYTPFLTPNIVGTGGSGVPLTGGSGTAPIWKPADEKAGTLHSLTFSQSAGQRFSLQSAAALSSGASHFATFKYTSTDTAAANNVNAPLTLFGYNSSPQIWSAGFSGGTAQYNYGSGGGGGGGSSFPSSPITSGSYSVDNPFTLYDGAQNDWIYVPNTYDRTHNTPTNLFLFLHGNGGDSSGDIWTVSPGGSQDWISICPGGREASQGHSSGWNENMPGGVTIVMNAIAYMKTRFNISPTQVFLGGYSGGGDLAYECAFKSSATFAGVISENTNPWRDNDFGNSSSAAFAANTIPPGWKFNIAHLLHTSDGSYPRSQTLTAFGTCTSNGYPVSLTERAGGHSDATTNPDLIAWFPQWLAAGWVSPGGTVSGSITNYNSNANNLNDGKAHTICWTHGTDGTLKVYVDGVLNNSWSGVTYNTGALLNIIGGGYSNTDCYDGSVAEAYSYNGVLTDQNVRDLHSRATVKWF
jgi:aryl-phospho-beta-D-glucosidase BglC (GH1 family)/predicted esterase